MLLSTVSTSSEVPRGLGGSGNHTTSLGAQAILTVTGVIVGLLTTAACVKAVSDSYLDQPADIATSLRYVVRRLGSLVWLEIVFGALLVVAFVALIIPGIWLYVAWSVATPALLVEGHKGFGALRRSFRLVRGRWWATAAVLAVASLMVSLVAGAIEAIVAGVLLTGSGSSTLATVTVVSAAAAISSILTRPFQAAVTTVLYYDLRVRHEGYDVALLAEQLGIEPAQLPPGALEEPGPGAVGGPGGPPFWPPPPGWKPSPAPGADGEQR